MAQTTARDFIIHVAIGALATFFVSWLDIRPMGILCIAGLLTWIYSLFCPCRFTLENVKPIKDKLRGNVETFAQLRREKPAIFCLIVSVALFLLMILGHILSGTWLVIGGLSILGFISSKHSIRIVRAPNVNPTPNDSSAPTSSAPTTTSVWSTTIAAAPLLCPTTNNSDTDDEFLPEANESAMHVLNLAGDDAILLSEKKSAKGGEDDDSDSMLLPDGTLPDVERDSLTDDSLSDDEFRLRKETKSRPKVQSKSAALLDLNTSDEEDSLSRGLNYDEYNVVDSASQPLVASYHSHKGTSRPKEEHRGLTDFVANIIPWNKVGNLVGDQMTRSEPSSTHQPKETKRHRGGRMERSQDEPLLDTSSDDSEFEILNPDELQNYGT